MKLGGQQGFSLVEILVVVAILAVLASILFAVMASAKNSAFQASETAQLKQIYIAINLYEEDHDHESPNSLANLTPAYVKPSFLTNQKDVRMALSMPDWPANPWSNMVGIDPLEVSQLRFPNIVSYCYLRSFESRFPSGRTFSEYRNDPKVGLVTGLGLMKCSASQGKSGCSYPIRDPILDAGQPAINLEGAILTVRTDGSIVARRRPPPALSTLSYEQLFLFYPLSSTRTTMNPQ